MKPEEVCVMRLWHDDQRPSPPEWVWARTNTEAKYFLRSREVVEISLDHDLGLHVLDAPSGDEDDYWDRVMDVLEESGEPQETGLDLVEWMIEYRRVPPIVTIHSWNPNAAMRMALRLADNGYPCTLQPFDPRRRY